MLLAPPLLLFQPEGQSTVLRTVLGLRGSCYGSLCPKRERLWPRGGVASLTLRRHPQLLHLHLMHPAFPQQGPKANQDIPSPLSQRDPLGP